MTDLAPNLGIRIGRSRWPLPAKTAYQGVYVDLRPLEVDHADRLWPQVQGADESFTYLRYGPYTEVDGLRETLADLSSRADQPFWLVTPKGGQPSGWLSICDVYADDGSAEIGSIWFAPALQGTREAREALFILMKVIMDDLAYERLVWRCQAQNAKSMRAAVNLGFTFEGIWRRAAVVDGWQRDVAWYSILRDEWPDRRQAFESWLAPENFDAAGRQQRSLSPLP